MVTLVVATTTDPASIGPASALLAMPGWQPGLSFEGITSFVNEDVRLLQHDKGIVEEDHLDKRWEQASSEVVHELIFLSKHTAVSNRPALTIHPIGVPHLRQGDVPPQGGKPGWAAPPSPRMAPWLKLLKTIAESRGLIPEFEYYVGSYSSWTRDKYTNNVCGDWHYLLENVAADALSRGEDTTNNLATLHAITFVSTSWLAEIKQSWISDPMVQQVIADLILDHTSHRGYRWEQGILTYKGKLVVENTPQLKIQIMEEFHCSAIGGHSGIDKTTKRIQRILYWKGLKNDVSKLVSECDICQRFKGENVKSPGLLQPLAIPNRVWSDISMDFIEGLPKSHGRFVIFVVVDRLTKYGHFMALSHPYTAEDVAQVFLDQVYKLHGLPSSIVSDRDEVFTSNFWHELFTLQGCKLCLSSAYHPQTDGQTEILNKCLENYLRCMSEKFQGSTEEHWRRQDAAQLIWEGLGIGGGIPVGNWSSNNDKNKVLLGIGGGHYVPRHMDIVQKDGVWVGHLLSGYSLPMEDPTQPKGEINAIGGTWRQSIKVAFEATKEAFPGGDIMEFQELAKKRYYRLSR
ncbi:unnamed protein product [Camellia sinensis]